MVDELDSLTQGGQTQADPDIKQKILRDLRHLEKVVQNKISEIEAGSGETLTPFHSKRRHQAPFMASWPALRREPGPRPCAMMPTPERRAAKGRLVPPLSELGMKAGISCSSSRCPCRFSGCRTWCRRWPVHRNRQPPHRQRPASSDQPGQPWPRPSHRHADG